VLPEKYQPSEYTSLLGAIFAIACDGIATALEAQAAAMASASNPNRNT
ncbi:hypothetical protein Tco_0733943, partial [Tanacetum coccineum]